MRLSNPLYGIVLFLKDPSYTRLSPALGEATISGLIVEADNETGLAKKIEPVISGGILDGII